MAVVVWPYILAIYFSPCMHLFCFIAFPLQSKTKNVNTRNDRGLTKPWDSCPNDDGFLIGLLFLS